MQFVARLSARRIVLIAVLALAFACAAARRRAQAHVCGYSYDETYRQCGTTHVLITAENLWGTEWTVCVGPGDTFLKVNMSLRRASGPNRDRTDSSGIPQVSGLRVSLNPALWCSISALSACRGTGD